MGAKILLVEDDIYLNELISDFLSEEGFLVLSRYDSKDIIDLIYEEPFDLFIFDVKLPSDNGFALLKDVRKMGNTTPAIISTSLRTIDDLEEGYKSGCDDYLKKPYELKELLLRVKSLLKRDYHTQDSKIIIKENIVFDLEMETLEIEKRELLLPHKERLLLKLLLKNRGKFVSLDRIFEEIWSLDEEPSVMSLRVYIKELRKILGKELIENQKNEGYRLL